ncbi:MAG: diguanylate cyclase [Phycisphaerae bacterium]|nr:diguanylate cyclase [Phycisphaerae bacterium]
MLQKQFMIFFILTSLAAAIAIFLALSAWRRRPVRGTRTFMLLMLAMALWTASVGCGMLAGTPQTNFFWIILRMTAVIAVPVLWLAFALEFVNKQEWLRPLVVIAISFIPFISLILLITNNSHGLFVESIEYSRAGPFMVDAVWNLGSWFWVHLLYSYILILVGDFYIIREAIQLSRTYRWQGISLIAGTLLPLIVNVAYVFHLIPELLINYDSLGFIIAGIAFSFGMFRWQLFDLLPIARRELFESMLEGVLVIDDLQRVVDINPAACRILGVDHDASIGMQISSIFDVLQIQTDFLVDPNIDELEVNLLQADKQEVYDLRISPLVHNNKTMGRIITLRDITRRKELEQALQTLSITDPLTLLYNRRYFEQLGLHEWARADRYGHTFSLLMFDVDDFKDVNDTYGHQIGDQVLIQITRTCAEALREVDVFCRYGGEEFVVLMPETGSQEAARVAERLRRRVTEIQYLMELPLGLTISVGATTFSSQRHIEFADLVSEADTAMYQSKAQGKNRITCITE